MEIHFFIGKGGVGKTTSAAAYALARSRRGARTFIVSLDPAHNLGDVLGTELGEDAKKVCDNLWASEVDFDAVIARHLKSVAEKIKDAYAYLRVLNLDKYIDTLRYSPGVEEYAVLEKITEIVRKEGKKYEVIVFDTPPTGLTIRMLVLPFINRSWIEKLIELRRAILHHRAMVARLSGEEPKVVIGGKEESLPIDESSDPIMKELKAMLRESEELISMLRDPSTTSVHVVVNPETLPVLEAERACSVLRKFGIPVKSVIVNKVLPEKSLGEEMKAKLEDQKRAMELIKEKFPGLKVVYVPMLPFEPRGIDKLMGYARYIEPLLG
ncbi:MAG: ArsA family ATPase [Crenarchaeota archaeon]|nr:ArsA family ATPase [Thermoproteota archaeon]